MAPPTRRIRRAPLADRIKAYLNPWDFFLWLSEELNDNEWDEFFRQWATPAGIALNVIFMVSRANSSGDVNSAGDDVFSDYYDRKGSGWLAWFSSFVVNLLALLSFANAVSTFVRKRHYRLFEAPVEVHPSTPSARRVHVDSSPLSSSPMRYLSNIIASTTAESRAHPDATRDVWEVAVWDPKPAALRLFCLFSPGHVLVYWLFLPLKLLDPRPSVTVVTAIAVAALLSTQLLFLQTFFSQQNKDSSLIHKEVQHEYDKKFVHPSLFKAVRDVGTQVITSRTSFQTPEVLVSSPTTYVNRGFQTKPNPNYIEHVDPDANTSRLSAHSRPPPRSTTTPSFVSTSAGGDFSSPLRSNSPGMLRQPQFQSPAAGEGGSLGVHSHARSPLRAPLSPGGRDPARQRPPFKREGSPLKRISTPADARMNGAPLRGGSHAR